jgi:hypothetical protein
MLRWSLLTVVVAVLLALCGLVFLADGSWVNLVKNVGYAVTAIVLAWGVVTLANHFKLTGEHFSLGGWLDIIAGAKPAPSPDANRVAMAIVLAGFLLGVFVLAGLFVAP